MSLFDKIEEHAEHILQVMKQLMQHQVEAFGGASEATQEVVNVLEQHLAPVVEAVVEPVAEPVAEPVVEPTPVVETPVAEVVPETPVTPAQ